MDLMINHVAIQRKNATGSVDWEIKDLSEWAAIALKERLTLIRNKQVEFMDGQGNKIPAVEALKLLKAFS